MRIQLKLFATLRNNRFDSKELDIAQGTTVEEIIRSIGIPAEHVALVFVNNRHGGRETVLSDGDILALFPPIGGG